MNQLLFTRPNFVKPVLTHRHNDALGQINQLRLIALGDASSPSQDPCGQVLRNMRISQQWDPSALATRACLSLAQLYELETGGDTLFYSPSLRLQAAKKVSLLLGTQWDAIVAKYSIKVTAHAHVPTQAAQHVPDNKSPSTHYRNGFMLVALIGLFLLAGSYITEQHLGYQLPLGLSFDPLLNAPPKMAFRVQF